MWAGVDKQWNLIAFNPHFVGSSRVRLEATQLVRDEEWPLEGSIYAWALGHPFALASEPEQRLFSLLVDLPDFDRHCDRLVCPTIVTLQLAAFAHELRCFPDDAGFAEAAVFQRSQEDPAQDSPVIAYAPESFVPVGLFHHVGGIGQERAEATIAGHVQHAEERSNPATGQRFHYLRVHTYGAVELDVVADPTIVTGSPAVGGVVWGTFWLSGRLLRSENEKQRA